MDYRSLDILVMSAEGLKDVKLISSMDVYVVVSIDDDPNTRRMTPVHKNGGKNPKWNHRLKFSVNTASLARNPNLLLLFKLRAKGRIRGSDTDIGEVAVPLQELLNGGGNATERVVVYPVRTWSGKLQGTLKFSYKLGENLQWAASFTPPSSPPQSVRGLEYSDPVDSTRRYCK